MNRNTKKQITSNSHKMQNLENKNLDDSCCSYESYKARREEDSDSDSDSEDETFSPWRLEEKETINGVTF